MVVLTELQKDALTEGINLGMGVAAAALSEMVNEEVVLSAPKLTFMSKDEAVEYLAGRSSGSVSGVAQIFSGALNGQAMLLFAGDKSLELVRLLLQDTVPLDKLTEFEEEALNEIGNIILNAGVSSLGDMFKQEIQSDLPIYLHGHFADLLTLGRGAEAVGDAVLLLRVDFRLDRHAVEGYVVFLLNVQSVKELAANIDRYLASIRI